MSQGKAQQLVTLLHSMNLHDRKMSKTPAQLLPSCCRMNGHQVQLTSQQHATTISHFLRNVFWGVVTNPNG